MLYMWHIYMHIHNPNMRIKYWGYMICMPNLVGISFFGTYFEITCEVDVAVCCVLTYVLCSMLTVWAIVGMWQRYLFSDICQICEQCSFVNCWCQWLHMWHIYLHTSLCLILKQFAYMPNLLDILLFGMYLAITYVGEFSVGCVLVYTLWLVSECTPRPHTAWYRGA